MAASMRRGMTLPLSAKPMQIPHFTHIRKLSFSFTAEKRLLSPNYVNLTRLKQNYCSCKLNPETLYQVSVRQPMQHCHARHHARGQVMLFHCTAGPRHRAVLVDSASNLKGELDYSEIESEIEENNELNFANNDFSKSNFATSDNDNVYSETEQSVFVEGDTGNKTGFTHRRRVEREAMKEDADIGSAAVIAARMRRGMKEKQTGGSGARNDSEPTQQQRKNTLRHQVQDLSKLQPSTVATILKKCVIYNKGDIVAIDKPYGLPSHGGPGVRHNIDSLLPLLARNLSHKPDDDSTLHLVHRLDKETTGVMLLAKTEVMLRRLQALFRNRKIVKKYWVLTVGVPDPPSGIIDMPMTEAEIAGSYRMVVKPDLSSMHPDMKRRRAPATDAVTKYKVLDSSKKGALVELEAITGVKHQIRVHLSQGMACPILGDHKYSHYDRLAPQKLPISFLERLNITQQKVRTVPMHLHAKSLVIPEFFDDGRYLHISTKLPHFFSTNMKKLKLRIPEKK